MRRCALKVLNIKDNPDRSAEVEVEYSQKWLQQIVQSFVIAACLAKISEEDHSWGYLVQAIKGKLKKSLMQMLSGK